jgi:cellulose synthase/poly-beta-1,6-N-acetylglucosamine synthase-like glycosyltransferase
MAPSKTTNSSRSGSARPQLRLINGKDQSAEPAAPLHPDRTGSDQDFEQALFLSCGIGKPHVRTAAVAATANSTTIEKELIAEGLIDIEPYYQWLANELGLDYVDDIDPADVVRLPSMDILLRRDGPLRLSRRGGQITVITPEARQLAAENARLDAHPGLRNTLVVASPATIRRAVWQSGERHRVRRTTYQLDQDKREASARVVLTGAQGFTLALLLCAGIAAFVIRPFTAFTVLHVVLTLFFSGGIILRLWALASSIRRNRADRPGWTDRRSRPDGEPPPVYTLLIALRDEAEMAPAIVSRISALNWPKSLLDVKYICEAEDEATIAALEAQSLGPECEIVRIPDFGPRTKPKALQYALRGARGSLVAVYDAEDKPAPGQLREAWATFCTGDERLGCLQAPLAVANIRTNWLSGLFALEYSGLFRILIPFLARAGMPIPLGGTSNHFRRTALEEVGGWDPHNVTEDADLGMRLYAHGYRTGIIRSATVETAPVSLGVWIRQRTRWLKGWAQTWLVVMRRPMKTLSSLGPGGFLIFQLMIAGMLVSALAHPLMFVFIGLTLTWLSSSSAVAISNLHAILMWVDFVNIFGSYLTFGAIGWCGFTAYERARMKAGWLMLAPAYWLLMSYAGWRALAQLMVDTHLWEKTPHPADLPTTANPPRGGTLPVAATSTPQPEPAPAQWSG